jgi:hypothetical protein
MKVKCFLIIISFSPAIASSKSDYNIYFLETLFVISSLFFKEI